MLDQPLLKMKGGSHEPRQKAKGVDENQENTIIQTSTRAARKSLDEDRRSTFSIHDVGRLFHQDEAVDGQR